MGGILGLLALNLRGLGLSDRDSKCLASQGQAVLVSGRHAVESRLFECFKRCQSNALVCTNKQNVLTKLSLIEEVLKGLQSPPKISLYTNSAKVFQAGFQLADILMIVNIQKTHLDARFMVFDSRNVLMFLNPQKTTDEKALHIQSGFVARYLESALQAPPVLGV